MRAVLMVGGRGVRLRPFTATIPKPLVPVGGEIPIIELLLRQLRRHGVTHVTLATGHLGHVIRSYVRDGAAWGVSVDYWQEDAPLGTIGPLLQHRDSLPEEVLLLNGDLLCSIDYTDLIAFHRRHGGGLTIAASKRRIEVQFGVLEVDGTTLDAFNEKPCLEYLANMGIYVVSRSVLQRLEPDGPHGVDDLIRELLALGQRPNVYGFDGLWVDIGRPEDYDRANAEFAEIRRELLGDEAPHQKAATEPHVIDLRVARDAAADAETPVPVGAGSVT